VDRFEAERELLLSTYVRRIWIRQSRSCGDPPNRDARGVIPVQMFQQMNRFVRAKERTSCGARFARRPEIPRSRRESRTISVPRTERLAGIGPSSARRLDEFRAPKRSID